MVSHTVPVSHHRQHTAYRTVMSQRLRCFRVCLRVIRGVKRLEAFSDEERVKVDERFQVCIVPERRGDVKEKMLNFYFPCPLIHDFFGIHRG